MYDFIVLGDWLELAVRWLKGSDQNRNEFSFPRENSSPFKGEVGWGMGVVVVLTLTHPHLDPLLEGEGGTCETL